jgi:sulfocyanin
VTFGKLASGLVTAGLVLAAGTTAFAHPAVHHKAVHHKVVHAKKGKTVKGKGKATAATAAASNSKWMKVIAAKKTIVLSVNAGFGGANSGMDFDGYADGKMVVNVPLGWTVNVAFVNSGALPHSVVFEPWGENINSQTPTPAFPKAETPNPVAGTAPGGKESFSFKASKAGKYKFLCAFPGHAQLGMWDTMIVKSGLKAPSVTL